jgi:hypothetical protein
MTLRSSFRQEHQVVNSSLDGPHGNLGLLEEAVGLVDIKANEILLWR